jgi:hypothetical protein
MHRHIHHPTSVRRQESSRKPDFNSTPAPAVAAIRPFSLAGVPVHADTGAQSHPTAQALMSSPPVQMARNDEQGRQSSSWFSGAYRRAAYLGRGMRHGATAFGNGAAAFGRGMHHGATAFGNGAAAFGRGVQHGATAFGRGVASYASRVGRFSRAAQGAAYRGSHRAAGYVADPASAERDISRAGGARIGGIYEPMGTASQGWWSRKILGKGKIIGAEGNVVDPKLKDLTQTMKEHDRDVSPKAREFDTKAKRADAHKAVLARRNELREKTRALEPERQIDRQNWLSLIRLRGDVRGGQMEGGGVDERSIGGLQEGHNKTNVMVHGTFDHNADWAKPGSEEVNALTSGRNANTAAFQWSGGHTEAHRETAGTQLGKYFRDVKNPLIAGKGSEVSAVAHSHGGNVVGKALKAEAAAGQRGATIKNAVMLATPQMTNARGENTSWSKAGADRVTGQIISAHNTKDQVQTSGAFGNEEATGNTEVVDSGRNFHVPSQTPQRNMEFTSGAWGPGRGAAGHGEMHGTRVLSNIGTQLAADQQPVPGMNIRSLVYNPKHWHAKARRRAFMGDG